VKGAHRSQPNQTIRVVRNAGLNRRKRSAGLREELKQPQHEHVEIAIWLLNSPDQTINDLITVPSKFRKGSIECPVVNFVRSVQPERVFDLVEGGHGGIYSWSLRKTAGFLMHFVIRFE